MREHGQELVLGAIGSLGLDARALSLAVQPGVVDGQRDPSGQVLGQPQVVRAVALVAGDAQPRHRAQRTPARDHRHREERARPQRGEDPLVLDAAGEAPDVGGRRLGQEDRAAEPQGVDHRARILQPVRRRRHAPRLVGERGVGGIGVGHAGPAHAAVTTREMHHAPVGVVGHHQPRDGVQSPGVVERGGQDAADVGQQPGPARPRFGVAARPLLAGEELHVSQRDGGVVGQPHQDGLVALAERARAAVVDVDQALDALAHPDRCDHHRLAALGADHRRVVGMQAAIVEDVGGAHRAAGRQHLTAEALARLQQHVLVAADPGADRVAVRHALAAVVPQRDPREVGAAQVLGGRRHLLEHRVEVEGGVDGPRQLGQQLGLATPGFGLGVQARIVEGDGSVIGERLGQPHLVRRERAAQAVAEGEGADRPALEAQRQRQDRPVLGLLDPGARGLGKDDVRIGQHVVARHRPAPAHGGADHAGVAWHDPADLERPHVTGDRPISPGRRNRRTPARRGTRSPSPRAADRAPARPAAGRRR